MNINDNASRVICTTIIWTATALIFVFGFFAGKLIVDGIAVWFWGAVGLALAAGPVVATCAIWKSGKLAEDPGTKPGMPADSRA